MANIIAVRTETRRLRAIYRIAPPLAVFATMLLGFEVLDLRYLWVAVLGIGAGYVVTIALNLWITGRPLFFSLPFKR